VLKILDRYVIREVLPPFLLAMLVFTFLLIVQPVMEHAEALLAKGVPLLTVGHIILTLVPQALAIAIPIGLLVGLLVGFGRLSSDRELVAMLAGGVSLYRLLRPVAVLSVIATAVTLEVMIVAIPDANQTYREITYGIVEQRAQDDIKPRVFFEDFPNKVLYVRDTPESGDGWRGVFVADTSKPGWPVAYVAERGRLVLNRAERRVDLILERGVRYSEDDALEFGSHRISLDPEAVFPRSGPQRGIREMSIADLQAQIRQKEQHGIPFHSEVMALQQKFSIPVACLVFGVIGLGLGVTSRKDGRLAGFVLGLAVVFLYYVIMYVAESMTKGHLLPAAWSRWVPDLILGPLGVRRPACLARAVGRRPIALPIADRPDSGGALDPAGGGGAASNAFTPGPSRRGNSPTAPPAPAGREHPGPLCGRALPSHPGPHVRRTAGDLLHFDLHRPVR
jgi:lipopolysaccharide export system permease protein